MGRMMMENYPLLAESESRKSNLELMDLFRDLFINGDLEASKKRLERLNEIMSKIFNSPATGDAFIHLLRYGACTSLTIMELLGIPEATAFRAMKNLRELGLLEPALKASKPYFSKGGPRTTVWVMVGANAEKVAWALRKHVELESKKWRHRY